METKPARVFPRIAAGLLFFAGFEGLIFHTRLYPSIVEPESTIGVNRAAESNRWSVFYPLRALATFALVMIGWVFFRAATFADSWYVSRQMFTGAMGTVLIPAWMIGLVAITLLLALLEEKKEWFQKIALGPAWSYGMVCALLLLCVELIGVTDTAVPFVYFQF